MELRDAGIHAMTVCPGYVKTAFQAHVLAGHAPDALARGRQRFAITAEQCAEAIVRGLERDARTVLAPRVSWLFVLAERVFPRLTDAQLTRIYRSHE
jgi:short-subunit dehydrogenase